MIDLRSDTVTKPTAGMRQAMAEAEVGDDVFGEDPTANALQEKMAGMFGFEAALFVPSGTMANQLGVNILTDPGDEVLIEETGHIFNYESTASAHLSSVLLKTLKGENGKLSVQNLENQIRGANDWEARTKLIAVENTTNKGGGCCYEDRELSEIRNFADKRGLFVHLDGARIWNAMTATNTDPAFYGTIADTMSLSFSKGLGAPVGSVLLASDDRIGEARRMRKMWGGGMRQIGILAAAAEHAVEHHLPLLKKDHRRAAELAETITECDALSIDVDSVETNILIFDVKGETAESAVERLKDEGVRVVPFGPQTLRATFHFQVTDTALEKVKRAFKSLFN